MTSETTERKPRLLRDLVSLIGGQFISMVIGFVAFTYLARVLDTTSYGALEFAIALTSFYTVIVECGLGPVGVRHIALNRACAPDLGAWVPATRLVLAFLTIPFVGLTAYLTGQDQQTISLVWLFAISLLGIPWRQDWLMQGLERMNAAAPGPAIRILAFALGAFVIVRRPGDLMAVGLIQIGSELVTSIYYIGAQQLWVIPFRIRFQFSEIAKLIREGAAVGISQLVWAFSQYVPMVLVATIIGGDETAWFGAPARILGALLAFGFLYHFNLYPISARLLGEDRDQWSALMRTSINVAAWVGVGGGFMLTLFSTMLMQTIFGAKFAPSGMIFAILVWVAPIRLLSDHARWALVASGRQKYLLMAEIAGALALLAAGLILVPMSGSVGAATAAVIGNLVTWTAAHFLVGRHTAPLSSFYRTLVPIAVASAWWLAISFLDWGLFLRGGIALAGYAICAFMLGGGLAGDIRRLAFAKNALSRS